MGNAPSSPTSPDYPEAIMETTPTRPSEATSETQKLTQPPRPQVSTTFQSIEDGLKEWDAQDAALNAQLGVETGGGSKKSKKTKPKAKAERPVADLNAWAAEQKAKEELGEVENWVGKLLEYRNANPKTNGLFYTESLDGSAQRFKCTATISESATPFGGQSFSNKKDAKRYAAKKAIDYLIANKYMPSDGSVRFPKQVQPVNPPRDTNTPSFAAQVPDICYKLGISPPTYKLEKSPQGLGIWNVYALFEGVSWIDGRVGEFENIFGQKKAKEQCAEQIILFLKDVERQRNLQTIYSPPVQKPTTTTPIIPAAVNPTSNSPPTTPSTESIPATAQINTLCPLLGFKQPTYVLNKAQDNISLYSGYAHFDGDPRTPAKIGEFRHVYSKKGAKEKCAESVLAFLKDVERERLEAARSVMSGVKSPAVASVNLIVVEAGRVDLDEEERKRKRVSLDVVEKMVKQKLEEEDEDTEGAVVDKGSEVLAVVA